MRENSEEKRKTSFLFFSLHMVCFYARRLDSKERNRVHKNLSNLTLKIKSSSTSHFSLPRIHPQHQQWNLLSSKKDEEKRYMVECVCMFIIKLLRQFVFKYDEFGGWLNVDKAELGEREISTNSSTLGEIFERFHDFDINKMLMRFWNLCLGSLWQSQQEKTVSHKVWCFTELFSHWWR